MKRKLGMAVGLFAICAGSALGMTAPAQAAGTGPHAGAFILYEGEDFKQRHATFHGSDIELNNKYWDGSTSAFAQNGGSSMRNETGNYVGMWDIGTRCTGVSYTAKPHSEDSTFRNNPDDGHGGFDNKASCVKFL
ncbi:MULTISPECIES: hypothetical protein [unclassified Streptomyces]|uniref:hypothetical protein n=1 Tax=unclassified Streptomyces TaxID=2593676 RepID=UPI0037A81158